MQQNDVKLFNEIVADFESLSESSYPDLIVTFKDIYQTDKIDPIFVETCAIIHFLCNKLGESVK